MTKQSSWSDLHDRAATSALLLDKQASQGESWSSSFESLRGDMDACDTRVISGKVAKKLKPFFNERLF